MRWITVLALFTSASTLICTFGQSFEPLKTSIVSFAGEDAEVSLTAEGEGGEAGKKAKVKEKKKDKVKVKSKVKLKSKGKGASEAASHSSPSDPSSSGSLEVGQSSKSAPASSTTGDAASAPTSDTITTSSHDDTSTPLNPISDSSGDSPVSQETPIPQASAPEPPAEENVLEGPSFSHPPPTLPDQTKDLARKVWAEAKLSKSSKEDTTHAACDAAKEEVNLWFQSSNYERLPDKLCCAQWILAMAARAGVPPSDLKQMNSDFVSSHNLSPDIKGAVGINERNEEVIAAKRRAGQNDDGIEKEDPKDWFNTFVLRKGRETAPPSLSSSSADETPTWLSLGAANLNPQSRDSAPHPPAMHANDQSKESTLSGSSGSTANTWRRRRALLSMLDVDDSVGDDSDDSTDDDSRNEASQGRRKPAQNQEVSTTRPEQIVDPDDDSSTESLDHMLDSVGYESVKTRHQLASTKMALSADQLQDVAIGDLGEVRASSDFFNPKAGDIVYFATLPTDFGNNWMEQSKNRYIAKAGASPNLVLSHVGIASGELDKDNSPTVVMFGYPTSEPEENRSGIVETSIKGVMKEVIASCVSLDTKVKKNDCIMRLGFVAAFSHSPEWSRLKTRSSPLNDFNDSFSRGKQ